MNDLMKKILGINWKTTLAGVATFLTGVPGFIAAAQAWAAHQPVDWRQVLISVALTAAGAGLGAAKDGSTHSTEAQITTSTIQNPKVEAQAVVDAKVAAVEAPIVASKAAEVPKK